MEFKPAAQGALYHLIIVRPEPPNQFTAEPVGIPEVRATAPTAEEAVARVQRALEQWPGRLHWVPVPVPAGEGAPGFAGAGHAKDDPDFDIYLQEIERYRRKVEERECSSSSSTQTT